MVAIAPRHGCPAGIRERVEREDGSNGSVDLRFQLPQDATRGSTGTLEGMDLSGRNRVEDRLQERACCRPDKH